MYDQYFGFNTRPFSIAPDPRFFYKNSSCCEAFAALRYGIEARKGLIVITGAAGTGKTRLVKDFVQSAEVKIRTAFIVNPNLSATEWLRFILNDLGVASSTQDRGALTLQLKAYLLEQFKKHHVVALLVDEAQQLSNELLEEIRLLSNLETNEDKLIQIVLVGQPELEARLDRPELHQLKQRVALRCRLAGLENQEVYPYIQARLSTAGCEEKALFDPKAVEKITLYSNGIPRVINVICDNALLNCYARAVKNVSAEIIDEVARDLQLTVRPPKAKSSAIDQKVTKGQWRNLKEVAPLVSVEQTPLAEFQDFFKAGEQRRTRVPWQRSLASVGTGFVLGILAAAGLGAIFYSQLNRNDISEIASRIWHETNRRESLKTGAVEPAAVYQGPSAELKDVQIVAAEKPPSSTQQPEDGSVGSNPTPIVEASKTGPSHAADAAARSQAKRPVKNDKKNQEIIKTAAQRTSENRVGVSRAPANDRLEFDIYKAIANRAITSVEVTVIDGTVVLGGRVATENQKSAAAQAARSVPGVKDIRDQILVNDDLAS